VLDPVVEFDVPVELKVTLNTVSVAHHGMEIGALHTNYNQRKDLAYCPKAMYYYRDPPGVQK
jgi:hypothetical protein